VSIADYGIRWRWNWSKSGTAPPLTVEQCVDLLERARTFHQPTRAFWFAHREAQKALKNEPARQKSDQQFQAAVATSAWDYYLPGHTAGWNGDIDEAIRSYQAALRLQPDHYNSLFFLAMRLASKPDRAQEAIGYYAGAIALRPDDVVAYRNRGLCNERLGRLEEAEADFSAAIAVSKDDGVRCYHYQVRAAFYERLGQHEKAQADADHQVTLLVERLRITRAKSGLSNRETLQQMRAVALARGSSGEQEEAIRLFEELIKLQKVTLGPADLDTLRTMNNLASSYTDAGLPDRATPLLEDCLRLITAKLGPEHFETMRSMVILASAYQRIGKLDKAEELHSQALEMMKSRLGSEHVDTLIAMGNLAHTYLDAGKVDQGLGLARETHELMKGKLGPEHPHTITALHNLAAAYLDAGKLDEALKLAHESLELRTKKLGPYHDATFKSLSLLALLYDKTQDFVKAEALYRELLSRKRSKLGPEHSDTLATGAQLAWNLVNQKKFVEAEVLVRQGLAACPTTGPDAWKTFSRKSTLGEALLGQGRELQSTDPSAAEQKIGEAESLLLAGYEGLKAYENQMPSYNKKQNLPRTVRCLVELYTAWDKPEEAARWRSLSPAPVTTQKERGE
jgi:tetratricopeptide (TPR) repeat protein